MGLPKVILVATDFSLDAKNAAAEAVQLAKRLDARCFLVHAWHVPIGPWEGGASMPMQVIAQVEAAATQCLEEALAVARAEYPAAEGKLVYGDPRDAISKIARELHADLIVVGTHGRRGVSRLLLGSVAEWLVRHATCDVLVARGSESP